MKIYPKLCKPQGDINEGETTGLWQKGAVPPWWRKARTRIAEQVLSYMRRNDSFGGLPVVRVESLVFRHSKPISVPPGFGYALISELEHALPYPVLGSPVY